MQIEVLGQACGDFVIEVVGQAMAKDKRNEVSYCARCRREASPAATMCTIALLRALRPGNHIQGPPTVVHLLQKTLDELQPYMAFGYY